MRLIYDFTQQINSQFTYIKRELITHTVALKNKQLLLVCGTSNEGVVIGSTLGLFFNPGYTKFVRKIAI